MERVVGEENVLGLDRLLEGKIDFVRHGERETERDRERQRERF